MTEEDKKTGLPFEEAGETSRDDLVRSRPDLENEIDMIFGWFGEKPPDEGGSPNHVGAPAPREREGDGIPKVLDDFRILGVLGSGGLSTVYEAEQISIPRRVALKVLRPHLSITDRDILLFRREAEAAARQSHPGIVAIYSVGASGGVHFIAQELVTGGRSLEDRLDELRNEGNPPVGYFRETARVIADVADALQHAHNSGVIHRDVKPSNILISAEGRPKVSDFGLAKVEDALALSRRGAVSGTPYYMSPEQSMGQKGIDSRADIFSLGVTLYEALTLEKPFMGETSRQIIDQVLFLEVRAPREVMPRVPGDLAVICGKALEKNPESRFQTMADFAADLRRFLEGEQILARPGSRVRKSLRWIGRQKFQLLVGVFFLALMVITVVVVQNRRQSRFAAKERCLPIRSALDMTTDYLETCKWSDMSDGEAPSDSMLRALWQIATESNAEAVATLEECIHRCRRRGEEHLEKDAHYLLCVVRRRQADDAGDDPGLRENYRRKAGEELRRAGEFDYRSREFLVWRECADTDGHGDDTWHRRDLNLNSDHFVVHLRQGIRRFCEIDKGGEGQIYRTAFKHFEKVLEARPRNCAALTFLGRSQFFFARSFNYLEVLKGSIEHLEKSVEFSPDFPWTMSFTTLGQAWLLRGDSGQASVRLKTSLELYEKLADSRNIHNVYKGLGTVCIREALSRVGEERERLLDDAEQYYRTALVRFPHDPRLNVARAELFLHRGQMENARKTAYTAISRKTDGMSFVGSGGKTIASGCLVCVRVELRLGMADKAATRLKELETAIHSPVDLGIACHYLAAFPELAGYCPGLLQRFSGKIRLLHEGSPICLSALGVADLSFGKPRTAVRSLEAALKAREKWPVEARGYYWYENVRDSLFLAMAHDAISRLAAEKEGRDERKKAEDCLNRAEDQIKQHGLPYEHPELLEKVLKRAAEVVRAKR
jgi:serine/threonine protein kinase/tetratricopeptide (TPR) repeat protein